DATVIKKLRAQKAVLLGKTNMDEFAHGSSTENSAFGVTKNPRDLNCVSGGSSGGSAAAVAADMCIFALGTDTGGSVRCPAAYCGTVGLKPTYGRASRFGVIAMTSSTDVPGPITKTVMDAATVLQAIAGHDQNDFTTTTHKIANYAQKLPNDINNLKIGVPKEFFAKGLDTEVEKNVRVAIDNLVKKGAQVLDVSLPHTKYAVTAYYIITPSEISSNLGRFDGVRYGTSEAATAKDLNDIYFKTRGKNFGAEVKRRIMIGTYALSAGYYDAYYLRAQKVRTKVIEEFDEVFKQVDVLVTPTMPTTAFKIGANKNPIDMYLEDVFTLSPSLAGLPAVSIPCGQVEKLPVGLQIIGKKFCEETVLNVAHHVA
ncbi:MAG: Asp-tRNA(Asn)/Glu-tRNA(Gln) amidotransferase GatCAB subunit A, partial [Candidatus Doudnabacteria bacterium CG10_big_fil_rev_8_21_14_0_10_42_18]